MPESQAIIDGEGGKRVTITIAELTDEENSGETASSSEEDPNSFVIQVGKRRLTITIAE